MKKKTSKREEALTTDSQQRLRMLFRNIAYIMGALLVFLFALDLMISSLQHLGKTTSETIILATSNPFTGLFIGLLATAIVQSSSATTSMVVALVASRAITLEGALPIIMGANIGTTITSTIVSLGFITKKKEFKRAVAAGTYHNFFNLLTAAILFPLEYYFGFLSGISEIIAKTFFQEPFKGVPPDFYGLSIFSPVIRWLVNGIDNGLILTVLSFSLLFGSILFFRRILSRRLQLASQPRIQHFFFQHPFKSFGWGVVITAAIRSSSVTTSLVVPLVAKKLVKLRKVVPFILGANVGTTLTAFIAAIFNSNVAISIAIAHFLFNFFGVLIFFPIPALREVPVFLANGLGRLTRKYRMAGFLYVFLMFFFIPFSLIFFNKNVVEVQELTYETSGTAARSISYKVITKTFQNQSLSSWMYYDPSDEEQLHPNKIVSVQRKGKILFINHEWFEFNKPGYCRDGEDKDGTYQLCLREVIPKLGLSQGLSVDSVYVFEKRHSATPGNQATDRIYIGAQNNILVMEEQWSETGTLNRREKLVNITRK